MTLLYDAYMGDPISPEEYIELRKMRHPRPADYVVQQPNVKDMCTECGEYYVIELAIIATWNPITLVCPKHYGISAS